MKASKVRRERTDRLSSDTAASEFSPWLVRQCRFRHCEEMRVRVAPPKGIRLAKPTSSRLISEAGYEVRKWIWTKRESFMMRCEPPCSIGLISNCVRFADEPTPHRCVRRSEPARLDRYS